MYSRFSFLTIGLLGLIVIIFLEACSDGGEVETFGFKQPEHFPEATYTFQNNPISKEGFDLGKRLFRDPILSRTGTIACGSCHDQVVAFADPQHRLSVGVEGRVGIRNAPAIQNLAFNENFFWDGGVTHVDFIPINAIENPVEMDESLDNILQRLNSHDEYPALFSKVFGQEEINSTMMLHTLSQFMTMLVSDQSRYDEYLLGKTDLSAAELEGLGLFEEKCETCHSGVLFTNQGFSNNGLDAEFEDEGRKIITSLDDDIGKFSVPSLRNVELTAPYMHDGRFASLDEVLDHYSNGVNVSATLDAQLIDGSVVGIPLTDDEKQKIITFLHTLTDREFTSNPLFFNDN